METSYEQLNCQLADAQRQRDAAEGTAAGLRQYVERLLNDVNNEVRKRRDALDLAKTNERLYLDACKALEETKESAQTWSAELADAKLKIQHLEVSYDSLNQENRDLATAVTRHQGEITALVAALSRAEQRIRELERRQAE